MEFPGLFREFIGKDPSLKESDCWINLTGTTTELSIPSWIWPVELEVDNITFFFGAMIYDEYGIEEAAIYYRPNLCRTITVMRDYVES